MAVQDLARIEERIDRTHAASMEISSQFGGIDLKTQIDAMELAKVMAIGKISIPEHLKGNVGDCWAVIMLASEWRMSAIQVANKTYAVNGRMGFEASLLQAVVLQRAPIKGRLDIKYGGEGATRTCTVSATLKDGTGEVDYTSPEFGKINPKNSPLWKSDPDQQLFYFAVRAFCRRHFPDVIMGVFTKDELEDQHVGPDKAKDITPDKPKFGTFKKGKRGFDADHVERETKPTEPESGALSAPAPDSAASGHSDAGQAGTQVPPAQPHPERAVERISTEELLKSIDRLTGHVPDSEISGVIGNVGLSCPGAIGVEIAGQDAPASDAEARAAGDAQGSDGGPPSLFQHEEKA